MALEIRDPVHGFISREPEEQSIIDCPTFQRLRKLKQLAMANLVYPGANHTRFDHSLGVFHLARKMAATVGTIPQFDQRLLRLAALLHDIGHGPFSHVSEPILQTHASSNVVLEPKQQIHELIGLKILQEDKYLSQLLIEKDRQSIAKLLSGTYSYTLYKEIVSGPMDADKQDYLLRDSYFCGVSYGRYDIDRLHNILTVHDDGGDRVLAIEADGVQTLEQFVLARYYMTKQVYRHKIRLITDEMISRGITLGIEVDKIAWLKTLYSFNDTADYIKEYLSWHDERLVSKILEENPNTYAHKIFTRLNERKLFKCIYDISPRDLLDTTSRSMMFADIFPDGMNKKTAFSLLESAVADKWGFDKNLVICYRVNIKSAVKTESEVLVVGNIGKPTVFNEVSTIFRTANQSIQEQMLQIYAPVEYEDERDKKRKLNDFSEEIPLLIKAIADSAFTDIDVSTTNLTIPKGEDR